MAKVKVKFPKQLYVVVDNEGTDDAFLNANEMPDDLAEQNEDRDAGVYTLVRVAKIRNTTELV